MSELKRLFLLDPEVIFLNHASFGATPKPVFNVYQAWQRELERQPVDFLNRRFVERMAASRAALADYLGTQRDNLVYVTNATVGVNVIARSLNLRPGDEVLSTNHEYGACDRAWQFLLQKRGFTYINQPINMPLASVEDFIEQLWRSVTPQTKVVFLSHITSPTALIFPAAEVCRRAREQNILTVIDGAHAPGQIPINLEEIGADFYTGNLHKWLCAPKGAGFLYARTEVQDMLEPLVVSWGWESEKPSPSQFVDHHEWQGTRDIAAFLSVPAAIQFQKENHWDVVRVACHKIATDTETRIRELTGLASIYSNDSWFAQMVSMPLPGGTDISTLKEYLYNEHRIEAPLMEWNGHKLIRVSIQGYNTEKDVDALIKALKRWFSG